MIAYPEALMRPAKEAGISVPDDPEHYDPHAYPHWHVYLRTQLGAPMPTPAAHFVNAKVIAQVPADKIKIITLNQLVEAGLETGFPIP